MSGSPRTKLEVFRATDRESRELALLAKARGSTKSELIRELIREAAEKEVCPAKAGADR